MPEHDPIDQLESFTMGHLTTSPLPPSEIRRLGDRRRVRRRNAAVAGAGLAVLVAVGVPFALTSGGGGPKSEDRITEVPTEITYPGDGVFVVDEADTAKLTGTTPAFKAFVAGQAAQAAREGSTCGEHGITVRKYSSAGYASGLYNACGGYVALWAVRDGQWILGMGSQDAWDCETIDYLGVPRSFAGDCADEAGGFGPDEVDGIKLGMTKADVREAGGTVVPSPGGEACVSLVLPYQTPVENRSDGWFGLTVRVAAISARPGMKTPERIGLGSPRAKVEAAYPQGSLRNGYWIVPLGDGTEYQFGIEQDDTVGEMLLTTTNNACTE
ncbi:MAG: hypothetical protein J7518_04165 [Nocardioidaceae bacterium]|nr:hypothetical protein [Nocardioidaceae bacterium]